MSFSKTPRRWVGVPAQQVVLGQVELLPDGKKVISQDLGIERFSGELDLQMALALMGRFVTLHPGPRYRVHAGRARLLFDQESGDLEWVASLDEDVDLDQRDLPVIEAPWSSADRNRDLPPFPEETFLIDAIPIVGVDYECLRVARLDGSGWIEFKRNTTGSVRRPRASQ